MGKKENLGKAVFEMFGVGGEKNKNVSEESTLVISEIPDPPPEKQKYLKERKYHKRDRNRLNPATKPLCWRRAAASKAH